MNDINGEPEEINYFEKRRSIDEILFGLNLYSHCKKEIDYSFLCLETVDLWLSINWGEWDILKKKGIAYSLVIRGRRLLRAGQFILFKGFLPEAEILFRSLWETMLILGYILDDPTESRAEKYINFGYKAGWDFRMLTEAMLGDEAYIFYQNMSTYAHPSNFGRAKLIYNKNFQIDSIHDYPRAGFLLVSSGNLAVALCELTNKIFPPNAQWVEKHEQIYQTEIFKRNIELTEELTKQDDNRMRYLFQWLAKYNEFPGEVG